MDEQSQNRVDGSNQEFFYIPPLSEFIDRIKQRIQRLARDRKLPIVELVWLAVIAESQQDMLRVYAAIEPSAKPNAGKIRLEFEDLKHDGFLIALSSIRKNFDPSYGASDEALRNYCWTTTNRYVWRTYKTRHRVVHNSGILDELEDKICFLSEIENRDRFWAFLNSLKPKHRERVLVIFESGSIRNAAERLGIPPNALYKWVGWVRQRFLRWAEEN